MWNLGTDEAGDGSGCFANLLVGNLPALTCGLRDAMTEVVVHQLERDGLECFRRGRHLGEDVNAVHIVIDHPGYAAHLPLGTTQSFEQLVLVVDVAVCGLVHGIDSLSDTRWGYQGYPRGV